MLAREFSSIGFLGQADTVPIIETIGLAVRDAKGDKIPGVQLTILADGKPIKVLDQDQWGDFRQTIVELPAGTLPMDISAELSAPGKIKKSIPIVCNAGTRSPKTGDVLTMKSCGTIYTYLLAPGEEDPDIARARRKTTMAYGTLAVGIGAVIGVVVWTMYLLKKK